MPSAVELDLSVSDKKLLIGVVHLSPLPGAPRFGSGGRGAEPLAAVLASAVHDAEQLVAGGCDALVVENFGDAPFHAERVPPETVAAMARALAAVRAAVPKLAVGVNVLRNDARAALGLCAATGASFVRVNVHTGAAQSDQGLLVGRAAETLRERARLCPWVRILADVHVKHATPAGAESLEQAAEDTLHRGLADGLILTGPGTGRAPTAELFERVRERLPEAPLLVGSGLTETTARELLTHANGAIVGTWLKRLGDVSAPVDAERVRRLRTAMDTRR